MARLLLSSYLSREDIISKAHAQHSVGQLALHGTYELPDTIWAWLRQRQLVQLLCTGNYYTGTHGVMGCICVRGGTCV